MVDDILDEYGAPLDVKPETPQRPKGQRDEGMEGREGVAVSSPRPLVPSSHRAVDSVFMRACRLEPSTHTPIWLMRQAGRYMKEYREIRERHSFLELCKDTDLATEVTVYAVQRLGVDAAILFSDILLLLEPMGLKLEYSKGDGPVIHNPVRSTTDIEALQTAPTESFSFVYKAVRQIRAALPGDVPLIGFSGAPFTLASYMIEGGGSRNYIRTKSLMYRHPEAWKELMRKLVDGLAGYLNAQIAAGAQAVQVFDSWVGCLSRHDYQAHVQPWMKTLFARLPADIPAIHFGTQSGPLLDLMKEGGGHVIGLDWRVDLNEAWQRLGRVAVQGNLDPVVLFADIPEIRRQARRILDQAGGRPGHIFNLGHGVLPDTPVGHVKALVDAVHEMSVRSPTSEVRGPE